MINRSPTSARKTFLTILALSVLALFVNNNVSAKEFKITASSSHPPVVPWVAVLKNYVVPEASKRAKALPAEAPNNAWMARELLMHVELHVFYHV